MNRDEFLRELSRELRRLPRDEYEKAMDYYVEFFNDAGPENEKTVIADLGTPKEVAAQIIMDAAVERMHEPQKSARRGLGTIWMVILGVCAAPIALPFAFVILMLVGMLLLSAGMVVLGLLIAEAGLFAGGVIGVVCGIILLFSQPASALTGLGLGLAFIGLSILGAFLVCKVFKGMIKAIRALFQRIFRRKKA